MKSIDLIKVKSLTAKMARQITVVHFNDVMGKTLIEYMKKDFVRPLAWASGEVLDGIPDMSKAWLIEFEGNLYWMAAPYNGKIDESSPDWMKTCVAGLQQVFIN